MSLAKLYAKKFHKEAHGYYATWLPNTTVAPGTVGRLEDKFFFTRVGSLTDLGIAFDPAKDIELDTSPSPLNLKSTKDVKVSFKAAGEVSTNLPSVPQGKAGIGLEFSKQAGFVIAAAATFEHHIKSLFALEAAIKQAMQDGRWHKDYVLVTAAIQAPYADIFVSETKAAKWEFEVSADGQAGPITLGNANVTFGLTSESGKVLDLKASNDVTLALRLAGLKDPLFKQPNLTPLKAQSLTAMAPVKIEEMRLDLLESPLHNPWGGLV